MSKRRPQAGHRPDHPAGRPAWNHRHGQARYVVKQSLALLHQFRPLAIRRGTMTGHPHGLVTLGCALIG